MQTDLSNRDMITTQEWTKEGIETVLDVAFDLKRKRALEEPHPLLRDKVLAMLFFFASTRTRASFEAGMAQLGGHAAFIESHTTQIAHGDTAKEIGEILGRYFDGIAIRQCDWKVGNRYIRDVAAVAAGVLSEAAYAGWRVNPVLRDQVRPAAAQELELTFNRFLPFYLPLALTSLLALLIQPLGAAAISRMPLALESLAVWPVVAGLIFMFRKESMMHIPLSRT